MSVSGNCPSSQNFSSSDKLKNKFLDACRHGRLSEVSLLLELDAPINGTNQEETPLMLASKNGHSDVVKTLLEQGASVDAQHQEKTALMLAAQYNRTGVVKMLLDHGAFVNAKMNSGWNSLMYACHYGYGDIVKILLKSDADVNATTEQHRWTAFMIAAANGHQNVVELLKSNGAYSFKSLRNCPFTSTNEPTALVLAIANEDIDMIKVLVSKCRVSVTSPCLFEAMSLCNIEIVQYLIKSNKDILNSTDSQGRPPLIFACEMAKTRDYSEIFDLLISEGADINSTGSDGNSPLMMACSIKDSTMIDQLLSKQAKLDLQGDGGYTALMVAAFYEDQDNFEKLLKHGASMLLKTTDSQDVFTIVAGCNNESLIEMIIAEGTKQNSTFDLSHAVRYVIRKRKTKLLSTLCSRLGVKLATIVMDDGYSPLMFAAHQGYDDLVDALIQNGDDVNCVKDGWSPLLYACENSRFKVVEKLIEKGAAPSAYSNYECLKYTTSPKIAYLLIRNGAAFNVYNKHIQELFIEMSGAGYQTSVVRMLNKGIDANCQNSIGRTALMRAAMNNHRSIVTMLIGKEADISIKSCDGHTALSLATARGHTQLASFLHSKFHLNHSVAETSA